MTFTLFLRGGPRVPLINMSIPLPRMEVLGPVPGVGSVIASCSSPCFLSLLGL